MGQAFLRGGPVVGVELQHLVDQVEALLRHVGADRGPVLFRAGLHVSEVVKGDLVGEVGDVLGPRRAQHAYDFGDLIVVVDAGEEHVARDQLGENAAYGPDVDGLGVSLGVEDDLRRAVPASDDVFGEVGLVLLDAPAQSQIADLDVAIFVDQDVLGLDVAVDNLAFVHVLHGPQDLEDEVLDVLLSERVPQPHDLVQVGVHELGDQVDVLVVLPMGRVDRNQFDDVGVVQELVQNDLAVDPFGVEGVVEHLLYFLYGHSLVGCLVQGLDDLAVPALTQHLLERVLAAYDELGFLAHEFGLQGFLNCYARLELVLSVVVILHEQFVFQNLELFSVDFDLPLLCRLFFCPALPFLEDLFLKPIRVFLFQQYTLRELVLRALLHEQPLDFVANQLILLDF